MNADWTFPFVPQPPIWSLDGDGLLARFPWMRAMGQCLQEPEWHAEGDVLTHTLMVLRELTVMTEWRELPADERQIVFAAALLHDMAKPQQTKVEEGKIRSKGHARHGALMARHLFMTDLADVPFAAREAVVGLVRHHGVPAYFVERPDPVRSLITASCLCRLDLLCILATADARGRQTRNRDDMPDRIALFREAAEEHACLYAPYRFANDHSRVLYFRTPGMSPDVPRFDDTRSRVTILSGLPAAGKDTWVHQHAGKLPVIALDSLRAELDVDPGDDQSKVIAEAKEHAREHLRKGQSFIWNATNTSRMLRDSLTGFFAGYNAHLRIVYCEAPLAVMQERNARRRIPVPPTVMDRLLHRLEVPDITEAHTVEFAIQPRVWLPCGPNGTRVA